MTEHDSEMPPSIPENPNDLQQKIDEGQTVAFEPISAVEKPGPNSKFFIYTTKQADKAIIETTLTSKELSNNNNVFTFLNAQEANKAIGKIKEQGNFKDYYFIIQVSEKVPQEVELLDAIIEATAETRSITTPKIIVNADGELGGLERYLLNSPILNISKVSSLVKRGVLLNETSSIVPNIMVMIGSRTDLVATHAVPAFDNDGNGGSMVNTGFHNTKDFE